METPPEDTVKADGVEGGADDAEGAAKLAKRTGEHGHTCMQSFCTSRSCCSDLAMLPTPAVALHVAYVGTGYKGSSVNRTLGDAATIEQVSLLTNSVSAADQRLQG